MLIRTLSAIVGAGLWLAICFGGALIFAGGITILTALATYEFVTAYRRALAVERNAGSGAQTLPTDTWLNPAIAWCGVAWPLLASGVSRSRFGSVQTYALLLALLVGLFAVRVPIAARTGQPLGRFRALYGLVALGYIGLLFSSFVLVRGLPGRLVVPPLGAADRGAWLMLFVSACVWATDTFAYLVGRALGRRKLALSLSPGKTIEGALGGLLGAVLVGGLLGLWIGLPPVHGLAVGAIAGVIGQVGDLFESALKREIGIKDFGAIIPGHGGALDRFDSLLFVAPIAFLYLRCLVGV